MTFTNLLKKKVFNQYSKPKTMNKTVDLNRIPKWEVGKWYYFSRAGAWCKLINIDHSQEYPLITHFFLFYLTGRQWPKDETRTFLEPWEALILHEGCKVIAPNGVDWSVPSDGMPTDLEIEIATKAFFEGITKDALKNLPLIPIEPLPEKLFDQNRALLARNADLKEENDNLKKEVLHHKEMSKFLSETIERVDKKLDAENEQLKKKNERLNELEPDLAQAKVLLADWAIKLKYYGGL